MALYSLYRVGENILLAGFPVFVFPPFFGHITSVAQKYSVYRDRFGRLLGSCVFFCIFPLVLGIHSSNEVREALEKTNEDEFGHYTSSSKFLAAWKHLRIVNKSRTFSYKYSGFRRVIWKNIGLPDV